MSLESVATDASSSPIDNIVSLGKGRKVAPRSLVISPNLDALLEHEERNRIQNSSNASGAEPGTPESFQQAVSPQQSGPWVNEEYPGLPPPPRRVKGPKSPLSPATGRYPWEGEEKGEKTEKASAPSSSSSNPYINPAPTLDEVLMGGDGSEKVNDSSNWRQQSHPAQNIAEHVEPRSGHKMINKSKAQASVDMRQAAIGNPEPYPLGRNPDDPTSVVNTPWRRRPLISHGQHSSISSMDSTSTSSTRPASTEENGPRLSISSTIYPGSSDQSHQHSLFNEPTSYDMTRNSFMEIYSPANPAFNFAQNSPSDTTHEPLSPINFTASPMSENSFASYDARPTINPSKPPLPTTPKPIFNRQILKSRQTSPRSSPPPLTLYEQNLVETRLPPTTNFLDIDERADLVRKSRKLARVFGQTPGADAMAQQDSGHNSSDPSSKSRRRGGAAFNLDGIRRHSMPLSPDDVSFLSIVSPTLEGYPAPSRTKSKIGSIAHSGRSNDLTSHHATGQIKSGSRTSFIDLSDDEKEAASTEPLEKTTTLDSPPQSLLETMSLDEQPDDERRRKRERLAKLHRFLGSRVPANLVLGIEDFEASLPAASMAPSAYKGSSLENDENNRKAWLKRRRSNSSSTPRSSLPEELERVKEELDDKEKALNVRRAQKMEKVFGVAPPLTLYHTRHCPSPSAVAPPKSLPPLPIPGGALSDPALPTSWSLNSNRPMYIKPKTKKNHRPGTSESNKQLLPKGTEDHHGFEDHAIHPNIRHSLIYNHYQHSLDSLNDILDRDDRESLAELHDYLNNTDVPTPKADEDFSTRLDRPASIASTIKSERRRSLPARTSLISLAGSEYSITTPKAEITTFQLRRRRAAKLTQFFGVNYRELINDVLESIENGVEHEQRRGTLRAEEVEDLRSRLRNLKTKRQGLF